ncbi:TetR/AcrR family transcriptional regulator [Gorillibacterium sp. sgz5001074]|uniref:TetR/AcrR family transcriptional regulator n=1 Tax=Gorillibacterium sp. sgz5001074 TaxID=3446695 RepID=UPI003F66D76F
MTPKDDNQMSRRQQIIDAAITLFSTQGFYKTTTAHVAKSVGVTQPYVFHFFKSKEELYLAVLEQASSRIRSVFSTVQAPPDKLFEAMGHGFNNLLLTHRDEMLLVMQSYTTPEPVIRDQVRAQFALVYDMVVKRLTEANHPQPSYYASLFFGCGLIITMSEVLELPKLSPWEADKC